MKLATSAVPAVQTELLTASATCVFDLPEDVSVDVRRDAIEQFLCSLEPADPSACRTLALVIDLRLEAFCSVIRAPLVRAWLLTGEPYIKTAFEIAAFAPVVLTGNRYEFDSRTFFSLLLSNLDLQTGS